MASRFNTDIVDNCLAINGGKVGHPFLFIYKMWISVYSWRTLLVSQLHKFAICSSGPTAFYIWRVIHMWKKSFNRVQLERRPPPTSLPQKGRTCVFIRTNLLCVLSGTIFRALQLPSDTRRRGTFLWYQMQNLSQDRAKASSVRARVSFHKEIAQPPTPLRFPVKATSQWTH